MITDKCERQMVCQRWPWRWFILNCGTMSYASLMHDWFLPQWVTIWTELLLINTTQKDTKLIYRCLLNFWWLWGTSSHHQPVTQSFSLVKSTCLVASWLDRMLILHKKENFSDSNSRKTCPSKVKLYFSCGLERKLSRHWAWKIAKYGFEWLIGVEFEFIYMYTVLAFSTHLTSYRSFKNQLWQLFACFSAWHLESRAKPPLK